MTCGYLNRPDLTASKFVDNPFFNPFKDYVNHRLYQTGDLVRYRADGNIQYLQRNDKQIKLRGHRIELGEIEFRISQLDDIKQVVVVVREDQANDPRLVAYLVPQSGRQVKPERIRESLQRELPAYMILSTLWSWRICRRQPMERSTANNFQHLVALESLQH